MSLKAMEDVLVTHKKEAAARENFFKRDQGILNLESKFWLDLANRKN